MEPRSKQQRRKGDDGGVEGRDEGRDKGRDDGGGDEEERGAFGSFAEEF